MTFHRDAGKPRLDLLGPRAEREMGKAMEFGARKYPDVPLEDGTPVPNWIAYADDWRYSQLVGSVRRHVAAWLNGEDLDQDSETVHHLGHALADLAMLAELVLRGRGKDDRPCRSFGSRTLLAACDTTGSLPERDRLHLELGALDPP